MAGFGVIAYGSAVVFAEPVLAFFVDRGTPVFTLVLENFALYAISLLFLCPNMFAAYFFTAFGDGKRAAAISFCRTFVFMAASIEILPQFLGDLGLWLSFPAAEILAFFVSVCFIAVRLLEPLFRKHKNGAPSVSGCRRAFGFDFCFVARL